MNEHSRSVLHSHKSDEYETPQAVFDSLNAEFGFDLDPCATDGNHKCRNYFTKAENGLERPWGGLVCSVIHHTHRLINGSGSATERATKTTHLLCF